MNGSDKLAFCDFSALTRYLDTHRGVNMTPSLEAAVQALVEKATMPTELGAIAFASGMLAQAASNAARKDSESAIAFLRLMANGLTLTGKEIAGAAADCVLRDSGKFIRACERAGLGNLATQARVQFGRITEAFRSEEM